MSHELRTPLNSLMILAQQLQENSERNMTAKQVEYASVIRSSGNELLELLNSILDLAKVESGTVTPDNQEVSARGAAGRAAARVRARRPDAEARLHVDIAPGLPPASSPTRSACARS